MKNKKKRVIASILAISIFLQPVQTMTVSANLPNMTSNTTNTSTSWFRRMWPFGGKAQGEQDAEAHKKEEMFKDISNFVEMAKELGKMHGDFFKNRSIQELITLMNVFDPKNKKESTGIFRKIWGGIKFFCSNVFFGYGSIFPALVIMWIFNVIKLQWNNFWTRRELGDTSKVVSPMEARQNFLNLASGHKGQEEAKNKLLNIGVHLAYSALKQTPIKKLIFEVGPPGTGKTTLVEILSLVLGCGFFNVGASDVDPGSNKSAIDQIFGPRITRANNSEYFADSPVMKFLRATNGQPLRIVAINEFDKLSEKDRKNLMEFLRNAYDNGYAYINGEKINLENVVWVLTSNDEDKTLFESPSLMSRFEVIKFARLTFQNYIEILQTPFYQLMIAFASENNVHINFGNTIPEIAQKLTEGNTGARGVQVYVNTLTSKILNYIYSNENVDKVKRGEPIFINVLYDKDNDGFIIKERASSDAAEEANQETTEADAAAEEANQKTTEADDAAEEADQKTTEADDSVAEEVKQEETKTNTAA